VLEVHVWFSMIFFPILTPIEYSFSTNHTLSHCKWHTMSLQGKHFSGLPWYTITAQNSSLSHMDLAISVNCFFTSCLAHSPISPCNLVIFSWNAETILLSVEAHQAMQWSFDFFPVQKHSGNNGWSFIACFLKILTSRNCCDQQSNVLCDGVSYDFISYHCWANIM
jgi:hypothetical protein